MACSALPVHPFTGLRALGFRKDGRPIFPIAGGSEPPNQPPADPPAGPPAPPAPPAKGFPENTPVADMTIEQQASYWKHYARQHEDRVRAFGGLTPEQLTELQQKAQRADALEFDLMSDADRKVAEAALEARTIAESEFAPRLVRAEFRAELKGRVPDEELDTRLNTLLEPLDSSKFLTSSGDVDTAKVAAFVAGIAPATGTPAPRPNRVGPSPSGLGQRPGSTSQPSVASGRELYKAGKKSA